MLSLADPTMQRTELPRVDSSSLTPSRRRLRLHGCSRAVLRPPSSQGLLGVTPLDAPVALEHLLSCSQRPPTPFTWTLAGIPVSDLSPHPHALPLGTTPAAPASTLSQPVLPAWEPWTHLWTCPIHGHPQGTPAHKPSQEPPSPPHRPPQPAPWVVIATRSRGPPLSLPTSLFLFSWSSDSFASICKNLSLISTFSILLPLSFTVLFSSHNPFSLSGAPCDIYQSSTSWWARCSALYTNGPMHPYEDFLYWCHSSQAPQVHSGKEFTCQYRGFRRHGLDPWVRKIPWRREWLPTPVFLPGEFYRQRSLAGYRSCSCNRVRHDWAHTQTHTHTHTHNYSHFIDRKVEAPIS